MTTLRIAVTGLRGQVVSSLIERASANIEIIAIGRPQLDLSVREAVRSSLRMARCDAIVNAAAYTAVDKAESEPDLALRVNGDGAGYVAEIAADLDVPLVHLSTDYVFDGELDRPYREDDMPRPTGAYGRSKLAGEREIAARCDDYVILRTSWVYSPFGANFVKTMLRLGEARTEVSVVADQFGNPTYALDIADAILAIAARLRTDANTALRGVFHMSGTGAATWAEFADAVFAEATRYGRPPVRVRRISTSEYPTPALRPVNSRLSNERLLSVYGLALPDWHFSVAQCVARLLA